MAQNWQTKLIHSRAKVPGGFRALSVPVERASTVVFPNCESAVGGWDVEANGYTYGIHGTPTVLALAGRIAELEGGARTLLVPSGLAALTLVDMAVLSAGSHVLIPDNVYVPNRLLAVRLLQRFGVEASFVRPAWAHSYGCKSRRELVTTSEVKRNCTRATECGEEAWIEAAGR